MFTYLRPTKSWLNSVVDIDYAATSTMFSPHWEQHCWRYTSILVIVLIWLTRSRPRTCNFVGPTITAALTSDWHYLSQSRRPPRCAWSHTAKSIADIHLQRRTKSWELLTLYLQLSSSPTKARCVFQNSRRALSPTKRRKIGCWLFNRSTIVTPTPRPPVCMHLRPLLRPLVFLLRFDSGTCCPPSPPTTCSSQPQPRPLRGTSRSLHRRLQAQAGRLGLWT